MANTKRMIGRRWRERVVPAVVRRDGGVCHLCGQPGATSADHLIPRSHGGTNQLANLAAVHPRCNSIRGTRPVEVARADIARRDEADAEASWTW